MFSSFYENLADLRNQVPKMLQRAATDSDSQEKADAAGAEGEAAGDAAEDDDEVDIEEVLKQDSLEDIEQLVEKEEQEAADEAGHGPNQSAKMVRT